MAVERRGVHDAPINNNGNRKRPLSSSSLSAAGRADHLCVLVHGLYGHPRHFDHICTALREQYGTDKLHILSAQSNRGNLTYDGIESGGERVAREIESHIEFLRNNGCVIRKLSIVGYSLGGLISRYAIGLLYAKGYFDHDGDNNNRIQPVNYTTFATPHVGVRSPTKYSHLWNVMGARTISRTGRQLFMIDSFRDSRTPLLRLLSMPGSVFMLGLTKFPHRTLYANIINEKAVTFYTGAISKTDPFYGKPTTCFNYLRGFEPVVVDHRDYFVEQYNAQDDMAALAARNIGVARRFVSEAAGFLFKVPVFVCFAVFVLLSTLAYLVNAGFQTVLSHNRIRLHEKQSMYRGPLIVEEIGKDMCGDIHTSRDPLAVCDQNLRAPVPTASNGDKDLKASSQNPAFDRVQVNSSDDSVSALIDTGFDSPSHGRSHSASLSRVDSRDHFALQLALTPTQFQIIDDLNALGFRKFPVYINKTLHSHASIIFRHPAPKYDEGRIVIRHWIERVFHVD